MDLTGQLHNLPKPIEYLLSLPVPPDSDVSVRPVRPRVVKRRLGEARDAMVAVLRDEGDYLRVAEIYRRVEQRLDGPVSYQHVKDFLNLRSRGEKQLFERKGYGLYRLWASDADGVGPSHMPPKKPSYDEQPPWSSRNLT
jgi:hypothetical protein